ncbi:Protease inhibitor I4 serpin [Echinococcus multilocularis]|uniref:Protease inhibitor I4 serpin n=1 Tax=Echinococcus multilocularis TaxID=6211 RepID=A0A068Y4Y2_ECHMU|nr:Protease inhibitor I4 serpin [Echinococcus multilocularis]
MPKTVSGRVVAVKRFTMDLILRDVIRPLRHLPLDHTFYFVILDFGFSALNENTYFRREYERLMAEMSLGHMDIVDAVGYDINDKLSLDLKQTDIYFVDELFSLPHADVQSPLESSSTQESPAQKPIHWHIITLPSGSQALFTTPLLRKRLQDQLPKRP